MFNGAPISLVELVEHFLKLILSIFVGIYFITQTPLDVPESVLGQLGNRIQHALRAFTPRDQKAVRTAAETFRQNPKLDVAETIMEMGVGEALVSVLEDKGTPSIVQRTLIRPPQSRIGPVTDSERAELLRTSPFSGRYDNSLDRESAYELLQKRTEQATAEAATEEAAAAERKTVRRYETSSKREADEGSFMGDIAEGLLKNAVKAATSSAGRRIGTQIVRGLLGSLFKGR